MIARIPALAAAAALALGASAARAQDVDADTVVATVGETEITVGHMIVARSGLPQRFRQMPDEVLFDGLLDQLIQQNALAQSVENPTKATELTIENQRTGLLAGEALGRVGQAAVTDAALQEAYDARYADAEGTREYNAAHILVETEEAAQEVIAELEGGADFAELARERSTGPSGPDGGALGWFSSGMMVPAFEEAVTALDPGETSAPVETQFGWHVVRLNETRMSEAPSLEEVRGELVQELRQQAQQAHIEEIVAATEVDRAEVEVDPSILSDRALVAE
jgi:peptidyl-prolyl cis-trans isomerase C